LAVSDASLPDMPAAGVRTFDVDDLTIADVVRAKRGRTVSVCIPCRDEGATIGPLVGLLADALVGGAGLVDELIVLDDGSTDDTAAVAAAAGATVVPIANVHAVHGPGRGKGNALWASLVASTGDIVVWCDGDVTTVEPSWVARLVHPLLADDSVALVKADYHRPSEFGGGGRTTELVARPLLSRFFPELCELRQPLSGEYAARRSDVEQLSFAQGWGVEIAMLIDIARRRGAGAIAQVGLGIRHHRHHDLAALAVQAAEVIATILERAGVPSPLGSDRLLRPDGRSVELNTADRPPLAGARAAPTEA
jgi:glucosyl-3-phosphoglycerate synthase